MKSPTAVLDGAGRAPAAPEAAASALFEPFVLRDLRLNNRIVVSPMAQYISPGDGMPDDWHLMHLGNLAVSGAGLVFTEATAVEPRGRVTHGCIGLWSDAQEAALTRIVTFARRHGGAKLGVQLAHAGRKGSSVPPWTRGKPLAVDEGGWNLIGPSAEPYPGHSIPAAMDDAAMARTVSDFCEATERAQRCGFEVIEIHAAHGYLLHSFLSPLSNRRTDRYGGSLENRMRFPLQVFDAMRAAWPQDRPLGMRISATDWVEGGWTLEDSVAFSAALKQRGCDFVTASGGGLSPDQKIVAEPNYQVPFAAEIKRQTGMPTMAVGLITGARQAEAIVESAQADLVALGRGMLYDPRWAWRAAEELGAEARGAPRVFLPKPYERCYPAEARTRRRA